MNKKGFTLVELLAILVILAMIALVGVAGILNITTDIEDNSDLYDTIYMAAETYVYNNYEKFSELNNKGATSLISVIDLINNEYLKNSIINPKDNEKFTSDDYIEVKRNDDMTLAFDIVDSFPVLIKLNKKGSYITNNEEFVTILFDREGGTFECSNIFGVLNDITTKSLAIGSNTFTCKATANNGSKASLTETIDVTGYFDYNTLTVSNIPATSNIITLLNGSEVYTKPHKITQGCYFVEIKGSGFTGGSVSAIKPNGTILTNLSTSIINNSITYYVEVDENINGIKFYYKNTTGNAVMINNITVKKASSCPS